MRELIINRSPALLEMVNPVASGSTVIGNVATEDCTTVGLIFSAELRRSRTGEMRPDA